MKVTATHNINVDGKWYKAGETYEVPDEKPLPDSAEKVAGEAEAEEVKPEAEAKPEKAETKAETAKPAARRRKAAK